MFLGDLFELWYENLLGCCPGHGKTLAALRSLAEKGVIVQLLAGNRDFLAGPRFRAESGAEPFPGQTVLSSPWGRILLLHGDELLNGDSSYQLYRKLARNPLAIDLSRILPLPLFRRIAGGVRRRSVTKVAGLNKKAFAPDCEMLRKLLAGAGVGLAVAGHMHEESELSCGDGMRCVFLPQSSGDQACYRIWDASGLSETKRLTP